MKSFPVNTFLTHLRPHLDEIAARWMFLRWGDKLFPGASRSEIKYLTTGVLPDDVPPEVLELKGILPVGVGGGFLDEHPVEGFGRKVNECAATLMSTALSLDKDRPLQDILCEVRRCDLTNQVRPTQLSSLVKLRHRRNPQEPSKVIRWTTVALEALHSRNIGQSRTVITQQDPFRELETLSIEQQWKDERSLEHVRNSLAHSRGNSESLLTELVRIHQILSAQDAERARVWLREVLLDMYQDSIAFFQATAEINDVGNVTEFVSDTVAFPVLTIRSDTEQISQAARSRFCGHIALSIQRTSKGNTAIFLNTHNPDVQKAGLHLADLIRMIRLREQTRLGYPQGQWTALAAEGTLRRIRMWYFSKDADMILNGALTTPDVKPSKLTLEEILDTAQHAFKRELIRKWRSKHAIPSELQRRRGGFRTQLARSPLRFQLGASVNHVTVSLPTQEQVFAELERIMV